MLLNAVHSAVQVIGGAEPQWWQEMVSAVMKNSNIDDILAWRRGNAFNVVLSHKVSVALLKYKNGDAPSDDEALQIKRLLLCYDKSPFSFGDSEWDSWRKDDAAWRRQELT